MKNDFPYISLKNVENADLTKIENYVHYGGFSAVKQALSISADNIVDWIKKIRIKRAGRCWFFHRLKAVFYKKFVRGMSAKVCYMQC